MTKLQQRLATDYPGGVAGKHVERLGADHQHQRQQAARMHGDMVGIELDQRLAGLDTLVFFDQRGESLAGQVHGVQADMQQDLRAALMGNGDGVATGLQVADHARQGRAQGLRSGVDAQAIADHPIGEHRVRHMIKGHQHPGERCQQLQGLRYGHGFTCGFVLGMHGVTGLLGVERRAATRACAAPPSISCLQGAKRRTHKA